MNIEINGKIEKIDDIYDIYLVDSWNDDYEKKVPSCYAYINTQNNNGYWPGKTMNYIGTYGDKKLYGYLLPIKWTNNSSVPTTGTIQFMFQSNTGANRYPPRLAAGLSYNRGANNAAVYTIGTGNTVETVTINN